jgi:hypothetical protein
LTVKTNDSSSPVSGSVKVRNAWCGLFAVFPSVVVSSSFKLSVAPNETDFDNGVLGFSLRDLLLVFINSIGKHHDSLFLAAGAHARAFGLYRQCGILETPG